MSRRAPLLAIPYGPAHLCYNRCATNSTFAVERAKAHLVDHFAVVGVQEQCAARVKRTPLISHLSWDCYGSGSAAQPFMLLLNCFDWEDAASFHHTSHETVTETDTISIL